MGNDIQARVENVLSSYDLKKIKSVEKVAGGLINPTFKIKTKDGDFGLQMVHRDIPDSAMEDMWAVTNHLNRQGILAPKLVRSKAETLFVRDGDNARWRLYRWVPGMVLDRIKGLETAYEVGEFLGKLHKSLSSLKYQLKGSILHFHDTVYIHARFAQLKDRIFETIVNRCEELSSEVADDADEILELVALLIPRFIRDVENSGRIINSRQIIHGDPKSSNLLFNEENKVIGILDCDTFLFHYPSIDIGDALRSWCKLKIDDGHCAGYAGFDLGLYEAAAMGYGAGRGWGITAADHALFIRATKLVTLELVARFLIDVYEDYYFGWDSNFYPSRFAHNMARAHAYYYFFSTIK